MPCSSRLPVASKHRQTHCASRVVIVSVASTLILDLFFCFLRSFNWQCTILQDSAILEVGSKTTDYLTTRFQAGLWDGEGLPLAVYLLALVCNRLQKQTTRTFGGVLALLTSSKRSPKWDVNEESQGKPRVRTHGRGRKSNRNNHIVYI